MDCKSVNSTNSKSELVAVYAAPSSYRMSKKRKIEIIIVVVLFCLSIVPPIDLMWAIHVTVVLDGWSMNYIIGVRCWIQHLDTLSSDSLKWWRSWLMIGWIDLGSGWKMNEVRMSARMKIPRLMRGMGRRKWFNKKYPFIVKPSLKPPSQQQHELKPP